jgi:hypothetical protein
MGFPEMVQGEYFGVRAQSIGVDFRLTGGQASCCGVNLVFAGFGGVGFSRAAEVWQLQRSGGCRGVEGAEVGSCEDLEAAKIGELLRPGSR